MNFPLLLSRLAFFVVALIGLVTSPAWSANEAPDAFISRLSTTVLASIKADKTLQAGDVQKIMVLVDNQIMPNVDFQRMTSSAVGPAWRKATPEQKKQLEQQFKLLLIRTYSGALSQVGDQQVVMRPMRMAPEDTEVIVRTQIKGSGEPVQLDYRLEKAPGDGPGWKIYDINVLGVWLVQTYRGQFAREINANGLEGLIATLTERNQSAGSGKN
ncbi:MAG: ABC transporter substrate-binding protein [Burkholderiaceae bacterium]|nr:ABC transporter substrate-binding protein [Burkholderiaceae bacterium]